MPVIYLIEGPVGAGKSTYAGNLALRLSTIHLNLDEWMVNLFSPDRPSIEFMSWYAERKEWCIEQIWLVAQAMLDSGADVILELGLVQSVQRQAFYERVLHVGAELKVVVLDVSRDERARRVKQRNAEQGATYQMTVNDEVFKLADAAWESPQADEIATFEINFIGA